MSRRVIKYEAVILDKVHPVANIEEATKLFSRVEHSEFYFSYVVRKEYSKSGNLLAEILIDCC